MISEQAGKTVLLVEDHPRMRHLLSSLVDRAPRLSLEAAFESAEGALEYINGNRPDLVLADISLPGMSGLDLITELRARFGDVPCLVVSGHAQATYIQAARRAGAKGFVDKSDLDVLHEALSNVVSGKEYWQHLA